MSLDDLQALTAKYSELPPSANKLYFNRPGGGRSLTPAAEAWKRRFIGWLSQEFLFSIQTMREVIDLGYVLCLDITLHLPLEELVNKGWLVRYKKDTWVGKKGTPARQLRKAGQRRAKDRYKKIDVTNRYKLCEDAAAAAFGVDDRCNFVVTGGKLVNEERGVVVTVLLDDPRVFGIPEEYLGPP